MLNPIEAFLREQGSLILDGGLATELEARGYDLSDALWSARLLHDAPQVIKQIHLDYLKAGADCIITASYQATVAGFMSKGYSDREARDLLRRSVSLAREARDEFWARPGNRQGRRRPLVAASIGPYGAFLADGSEYQGHYGLSQEQLLAFHEPRWRLLAGCGPDLMACETIPSAVEARALAILVRDVSRIPAWISFSCCDSHHLSDGTPIVDIVSQIHGGPKIVALGVNCTPPRFIASLVHDVRSVTEKPIVVYPNSGERYDATKKEWVGRSAPLDFGAHSRAWRQDGAALIGGCCRTTPAHIMEIRRVQLD